MQTACGGPTSSRSHLSPNSLPRGGPLTLLAEPALPAFIAEAAEAAQAVDACAMPAAWAVALVVQGRSLALVTICERQRDGAVGDVGTSIFLSNLHRPWSKLPLSIHPGRWDSLTEVLDPEGQLWREDRVACEGPALLLGDTLKALPPPGYQLSSEWKGLSGKHLP